jgi:hypothetical protein
MLGFESYVPPVLLFVLSGAFIYLDSNVQDLLTPVTSDGDPKDELGTLRRRLVAFILAPIVAGVVQSESSTVEFEDVEPTYNFNLQRINYCQRCLETFKAETLTLQRSVKLAAISLLPAGAYTAVAAAYPAAVSVYPTYGGWFLPVLAICGAAAWGFATVGLYAYVMIRDARKEYNETVRSVRNSLSTLQTLELSRSKKASA